MNREWKYIAFLLGMALVISVIGNILFPFWLVLFVNGLFGWYAGRIYDFLFLNKEAPNGGPNDS